MEGSVMKTKRQTIRNCWKRCLVDDLEDFNFFHSETYLTSQEHIRTLSRFWNFIIRVRLTQTARKAVIVRVALIRNNNVTKDWTAIVSYHSLIET
jgi:hypothetical protein